jgi:hypothetical protein
VVPDFQVIWKFVGSRNNGVRYGLPSVESLGETYMDSRFWFGPAYYKEIEWIEFPRVGKPLGKEQLPATFFNQDTAFVLSELERIGQFHTEATELGFRLYGHT